jgi:hypothetical protein
MVIGVSRRSSRPAPSEYEVLVAEYYDRAGKYVQFYLTRCHYMGEAANCCKPREERVVIFGSSNTDFANSKLNGIQDMRNLLQQAQPGQKVVIVCS